VLKKGGSRARDADDCDAVVVRQSSACARTGRARDGQADCAAPRSWYGASDGRRVARGKNSRRLEERRLGKCAGTRSACGLGVRGSADTEATGARARCRRTERVRPISILLSACLKLINSKNLY
jgi:hypothetical protein